MNSDEVVDGAGVASAWVTSGDAVDENRLVSDDAFERLGTEAERASSDAEGAVDLGLDTFDASLEGSCDVAEIVTDVGLGDSRLREAIQ